VEKILLSAMLSVEGVQSAVVRFSFGEWSDEYLAIFKVKNYAKMRLYRHVVAKKIWQALNQAEIMHVCSSFISQDRPDKKIDKMQISTV
jgi:hypothetical protein